MATADVRIAVASDAEGIATLQIDWWRAAYATVLPAAVLGVDPAVLAAAWAERIAGGTVLLATEGSALVGFAAIDAAVEQTTDGPVGTVDVLGVLPRWSRRGHGGRLIATAAGLLRERGATVGVWWAPEDDPTISAFVAEIGWIAQGGRRVLDTGEGTLAEVRYRGSLDLVMI
jgi:GNAT superfamily N-acetyltransferase